MNERKILSIEVTEKAKQAIDLVSKETGVDKKQVASRLYEWFGEQDDLIQKGILGLLPKGMEVDIVRLALEKMGESPQPIPLHSKGKSMAEAAKDMPVSTGKNLTGKRGKSE